MSASSTSDKRPIEKGDIVVAPFVGVDENGAVFYKPRNAYVAEVLPNGDATVVYISGSEKSLAHQPYAQKLDQLGDRFEKNSFFDAGKTNTISRDFLHLDQHGKTMSEPSREALERALVRERRDMLEVRNYVNTARHEASTATSTEFAVSKANAATAAAAKGNSDHQHYTVKPDGQIFRNTVENGERLAGLAPKEMLDRMRNTAPHRFPSAPQAVAAPEPIAQVKQASAIPEGFTKVVGDNGRDVMLMGGKKEALRQSVQSELTKAGHTTELTADAARKLAVTAATARDGDRLAVAADGTHTLLTPSEPAPAGATVVDAAAFRDGAKIAPATALRELVGADDQPKLQEALESKLDKVLQAASEALERGGVTQSLAGGMTGTSGMAHEALLSVRQALENGAPKFDAASTAPGSPQPDLGNSARPADATPAPKHGPDVVSQARVHETAAGPEVLQDAGAALTAATSGAPPQPGANLEASSDMAATIVRDTISKEARAAGFNDFELTKDEAKSLAEELKNARPGDQLVLEPKGGEVYLQLSNGGTNPEPPRDAVVLDADAVRHNAGISRSAELEQSLTRNQERTAQAESKREDSSRTQEMASSM